MTTGERQMLILATLLVATASLVRWVHYAPELGGAHAFRQTQTASIAELIYKGQGTFLKPTSYLGLPGDVMAVEPPVYQWLAAKICALSGGYADWKLRVFSTALGISTALLLGGFIRNLTANPMLGWLGSAFYCGAVLPAFFQTTPMPDNLILCLVSFALCALSTRGANETFYVAGGILASTLAVALKPPLACGLFAVSPLLLGAHFRWPKAFFVWLFMGISGCLLVIAWNKWGQYITADGYFCFLFAPGFNQAWNLGWMRLLQADFWILMPLRLVQQSCFLSLPFAMVALAGKSPYRNHLFLWMCGELLATVIFSNLNYIHNYYQLRFALWFAVAGALGWKMTLSRLFPARTENFLNQITTIVGVICLLLPWPILYVRHTLDDAQLKRVKQAAAQVQTVPNEECVGLIQQFSFGTNRHFSWDPSFAYFAKRQVYPIMEYNIGDYYYDNLKRVVCIGFSTILVVGNLTNNCTADGRSTADLVARVENILNANYDIEKSSPELTVYKKRHPPEKPRARD